MSIKISDAFESTRADKIIAQAINIKYNNKTQHAVNSEIYEIISQLGESLQDTYSKEEIDRLIDNLISFNVKIVETLPDTNISQTTIYLIRDTQAQEESYIEWLYVDNQWRSIGSTKIDLSDYVRTSVLDDLLETINGISEDITEINNDIVLINSDIETVQGDISAINTRLNNIDLNYDAVVQSINSLVEQIRNINTSTGSVDELDSSKVIYNDTTVKEVLDRLLYTPPTINITLAPNTIRILEYGSVVNSVSGTITFSTYNNKVKNLNLIYKVNNIITKIQMNVPDNALSVPFQIFANLQDTTQIYGEIKDDKDTVINAKSQYINFMYKSFCFVSNKSSIGASDIPTTGGYLTNFRDNMTVTFSCTPDAQYAYIAIPKVYCTSEPVIKDTNGFTLVLEDNLKYEIPNYVNANGIVVPMKIFRLKNPEQVPITVNIKIS